jgi:RHS repeat-associated protein
VGATATAFTFGGEQKDDETGLINLRARYYDPAIGRFLARDTLLLR